MKNAAEPVLVNRTRALVAGRDGAHVDVYDEESVYLDHVLTQHDHEGMAVLVDPTMPVSRLCDLLRGLAERLDHSDIASTSDTVDAWFAADRARYCRVNVVRDDDGEGS